MFLLLLLLLLWCCCCFHCCCCWDYYFMSHVTLMFLKNRLSRWIYNYILFQGKAISDALCWENDYNDQIFVCLFRLLRKQPLSESVNVSSYNLTIYLYSYESLFKIFEHDDHIQNVSKSVFSSHFVLMGITTRSVYFTKWLSW